MKRSAVVATVALALSLLVPTISQAAPKAGAKCTKKGKIQVHKSYEFTCIKKNGKLVWSKGQLLERENNTNVEKSPTPQPTSSETVQSAISPSPQPTIIVTPTPSPTVIPAPTPTFISEENFKFQDICEKDPFVPSQWKNMEESVNARGTECSWPYRIVKKIMPTEKPKSILSENVQQIANCQLPENPNKGAMVAWPVEHRQFWTKYMRHPSKNSIIQIVPLFSLDAPDNGKNPAEDYKPYFDFLKDWVDHASDGQGKLTIRVPSRYIEFPEKIRDFNLTHERPESVATKFREALEKHIVPKIDFTGSYTAIIVLPAGSDFSLTQQVALGQTRVGNDFVRWTIFPPFTLSSRLGNGANFIHPAWWLHELHHATAGIDDNDQESVDGLWFWGLMSWSANEMLGWQKWLLDLWGDDRVLCANLAQGGTYWLAPSTYQTQTKKLLVLPVSGTKAVVVESMRAGGLNYKMPEWMQGVLVYVIDSTTTNSHTGSFVLKPESRKLLNPTLKGLSRTFINSDVALKQGETTNFGGYKITVVESGTFGDVVRVEKA